MATPSLLHPCRVPLDFSEGDLLIVMGTSLVVNPFAGLIGVRPAALMHVAGGLPGLCFSCFVDGPLSC